MEIRWRVLPGFLTDPAWSTALQEGATVLYLRPMNLWSVQIGGKNLRQLTFGETSYISPDLDRYGNIVATRRQIQFDIWRYPVEGSPEDNVRRGIQITRQTGTVETPSPGPGDREVVYLSDSGGHGNLWVLNLTTGQNRQVTFEHDPQVTIGVPVWSPDGKYIAYVKRGLKAWNVDLWLMKPDGSDAHKVSDGGGWACWSPDSQWLYFSPPSKNGFRIEKIPAAGGPDPVGARRRPEAGGRCGRKALLHDESAGTERFIGHADINCQSGGWPGAKVSSYFGIALVELGPDAAGALS